MIAVYQRFLTHFPENPYHFLEQDKSSCDVRVCSRYPRLALDGVLHLIVAMLLTKKMNNTRWSLTLGYLKGRLNYGLGLLGRPPATTVVFLVRVTELPI